MKINRLSKESFDQKRYEDAIKYKKDLESLRKEVESKYLGVEKLRFLIEFKNKKWFGDL